MPKLTLSFKGHIIDVFHLEKAVTSIGRNDTCDIHIDSLAIAPEQALIRQVHGGGHLVTSIDEEFPVLVNHEPSETHSLKHGDVIQVGKHTLSYSEDVMELGADLSTDLRSKKETDQMDETDSEATPGGILQIINGDNFGRIIPLKRNMTRIGHSGGDCAMVSKRDDGFFLSFLEGAHPPTVNRHVIGDESYRLKEGDIIEVGGTQMQFHL